MNASSSRTPSPSAAGPGSLAATALRRFHSDIFMPGVGGRAAATAPVVVAPAAARRAPEAPARSSRVARGPADGAAGDGADGDSEDEPQRNATAATQATATDSE